jgi:hypothetical protein
MIQKGQRDRIQRDALNEIRSPVDRIKYPLQYAVASSVPLLLAKEANLRAAHLQVRADRPLDPDVDVGDHVTIALGLDSTRPLPTDDLSGQVHRLSGDRHVAVERYTIRARVHSDEIMASNTGNSPRSAHWRRSNG